MYEVGNSLQQKAREPLMQASHDVEPIEWAATRLFNSSAIFGDETASQSRRYPLRHAWSFVGHLESSAHGIALPSRLVRDIDRWNMYMDMYLTGTAYYWVDCMVNTENRYSCMLSIWRRLGVSIDKAMLSTTYHARVCLFERKLSSPRTCPRTVHAQSTAGVQRDLRCGILRTVAG